VVGWCYPTPSRNRDVEKLRRTIKRATPPRLKSKVEDERSYDKDGASKGSDTEQTREMRKVLRRMSAGTASIILSCKCKEQKAAVTLAAKA